MLSALDQFFAERMTALDLRAQRSEVLASNVANSDTPNYKARDFDFSSALQAAIRGPRGGQGRLAVDRTSAGHLAGSAAGAGGADVKYRIPAQSSIDGNTVELDTELGQYTDNAVRYQADLTFASNQVRLMQLAVAGQ